MMRLVMPAIVRLAILAVILAGLFIGAYIPEVGVAAGPWHVELHLLAFFLVGGAICWSLSMLAWWWSLLLAVMVPVAHEVCEMWGHHHGLEVGDIYIDCIGSLAAVALFMIGRACWLRYQS